MTIKVSTVGPTLATAGLLVNCISVHYKHVMIMMMMTMTTGKGNEPQWACETWWGVADCPIHSAFRWCFQTLACHQNTASPQQTLTTYCTEFLQQTS